MEYILLVALVVFILAISIVLYIRFSTPANEQITRTQGEQALESITSLSEDIIAYGEGSRNKIVMRVPPRVTYITLSGKEAFMRFDSEGGKVSDVVIPSNVLFMSRTFVNPPEGKLELIVGAKDDAGEVKVCVSEFERGLDCGVESEYVIMDAFRCRPGQMIGDLDDDGKISNEEGAIADKMSTLFGSGELNPPEEICCYDADGDGDFDGADVIIIKQIASTTGLNDRTC